MAGARWQVTSCVLPHNASNTIATKGIENIALESLFDAFTATTTLSDGTVHNQFKSKRKRGF